MLTVHFDGDTLRPSPPFRRILNHQHQIIHLMPMTTLAPHLQTLLQPVPVEHRKRVVVAMSGGVDSSVVAALLHARGHDVIGMTLQLYDHGQAVKKAGACCAGQDIHDARRVAQACGFPHYVLDYESRFRQTVIDQFVDSYLAGETPIPCVNCNMQVKFKDLLDTARELEVDALATGHYITRKDGASGPELHRAHDGARDQSYFLFGTTRGQLADLWFPLGELPKSDVRALAHHFGLVVANKSDSQDICFVPDGRYAETIEKLKPGSAKPGDIVHMDGRVLGRHEGVIHYTIGQRRGLGVATGEPLFVAKINAETGQVFVGPRDALQTSELILRDVNWLGDGALTAAADAGLDMFARVRSTQPPEPARLGRAVDGTIICTLLTPAEGIARGQACVFYENGSERARVLGGGWIAKTDLDAQTSTVSETAAERGRGQPTVRLARSTA
ncbi:MAG: tRNA 2-thiouridine(34) synthase MnmA [Pseudomonadota bacterium]